MRAPRFHFRTKLAINVAAIALSFILLIIANILIADRVAKELREINKYYIPLIETGPRVDAQLGLVMRSLQDAVAANDREALAATEALNQKLVEDLKNAATVIYPDDPARIAVLDTAIKNNYSIARDVSTRLMNNETGMPLVNAMNVMQATYAQTKEMLHRALLVDSAKLAGAFTAATEAQKTAEQLQFFISGLCLISVMLLSIWISRSVVRSLTSLTKGLVRFGNGNFDVPIPVTSQDELGEVAQNANLMAKQIQGLLVELKATNKELESFSYSVAHDLRAPLRASIGFSNALLEDYLDILPLDAQQMLNEVSLASKKMGELIDGLLALSRIARNSMVIEAVNLSEIAVEVLATVHKRDPDRRLVSKIEDNLITNGDPRLLRIVLVNLIENAWKFTRQRTETVIEFGHKMEDDQKIFYVRDNGAGFDMHYSEKLFSTFQRLHSEAEFEGTGIGLATVQRIIHRHHGRVWATSEPDKGATFFFYLG